MQTNEINGFLIDQFNQYSLKQGATQGICPLCSSDRQPKNQKAQCASYDWERGLGTCHNCDTTFQLHTYQRKGASERVYVRPTPSKYEVEMFCCSCDRYRDHVPNHMKNTSFFDLRVSYIW